MAKNGKMVGKSNRLKRNVETVTGSKAEDIINNLYDLYGCHYEWTLEANDSIIRVLRGGSFSNDNSPAYRGNSDPYNAYSSRSSRAIIYIK